MSHHSASLVIPGSDVVHCDLDGDAVLLNLETRRYFKLNRVSAFVWSHLGNRAEIGALRQAVIDAFDVDPDRCARDLDDLLQAMSAAGLIDIRHVSVA